MFSLAGMTFLFPALLAALAAVPVLWWILRVMPPRARAVKFPAFFLLQGLKTDVKTAARTPWWLLLLRCLIAILLIGALAEPVLRIAEGLPGRGGSVLVTVDNGWSSAINWDDRVARMREYMPQIGRSGRSVFILPTAASGQDGKLRAHGPMDAAEAEKWLEQLKPYPWPADHGAAEKIVAELTEKHKISHSVYFNDGVAPSALQSRNLILAQMAAGGLTLVADDRVNTPYILRRKPTHPSELSLTLERLVKPVGEQKLVLAAHAADGSVLDELNVRFAGGESKMDVTWDVLSEMRNRVSRISVRQAAMASAVFLTDSQWQQHPVGIIADSARRDNAGFLNEVYYLKRALELGGKPTLGSFDEISAQPLSAVVWPDSAAMTAVERVQLLDWVRTGGFLIRFAGPNLSSNPEDPLLPVELRYGQRAMQGALTWEKPLTLGGMAEHSPLRGLAVPEDVKVIRQVLATPTPEVFEKTWLQLSDGTPLVTGGAVGKGMVVLVHTTAGPDWSDFCYSGLYVEMLQRLISLSTGAGEFKGEDILPPLMLLDAFGRLQTPDTRSVVRPIDPRQVYAPAPEHPPGLYGAEKQFKVYNLGAALPPMVAVAAVPSGVDRETYQLAGERSMKPDLVRWALWLLLVDTIVTLFLRGVLHLPSRRAAAGVVVALFLMMPAPANAQTPPETELLTGVYLAYVETGDQATDRTSYNGLLGLQNTINMRTNIKVKGVVGVNPSDDALYFYPFLYWPMTEAQMALPGTAARNIQTYMAQGGMILFDTRDQQFAPEDGSALKGATIGTRHLRKLTENIQIAELAAVETGHILTKSFYLLNKFPGLYDGGTLWAEKEPSPNHDGVTSVLIGGNDWATAWSEDPADRNRFARTTEAQRQREMAIRFGINLVMVALAGNYKADQVHVPYILQRISR